LDAGFILTLQIPNALLSAIVVQQLFGEITGRTTPMNGSNKHSHRRACVPDSTAMVHKGQFANKSIKKCFLLHR